MKTKEELISQLTDEQRADIRTKLTSVLYLMNYIDCDLHDIEDYEEFKYTFLKPDPSSPTLWCQLYELKELL